MMDYTLELGVRVNVFFLGLVLSEDFVRARGKGGVTVQRGARTLMSDLAPAVKGLRESCSFSSHRIYKMRSWLDLGQNCIARTLSFL